LSPDKEEEKKQTIRYLDKDKKINLRSDKISDENGADD